jgi:hypothetical protein
MATWTTLPDASLEPGKPIRSIDGLALRDNPVAITEGAVGAPKIQTNGITDSAVTTAKLVANEQMTTANVLNATAGASAGGVGTYMMGTVNNNNTSYALGATVAGSVLRPAGVSRQNGDINIVSAATNQSGTWRVMGQYTLGSNLGPVNAALQSTSLWLRIS